MRVTVWLTQAPASGHNDGEQWTKTIQICGECISEADWGGSAVYSCDCNVFDRDLSPV